MAKKYSSNRGLLESERGFRLLVQGVIDYAIYMLDPTGHVVNWNAGAERIEGYAASEIVGRHFSTFYRPEDREAGLPVTALETARRTGTFEAEGWRVRKDGTKFWASVVIDAIYEDGELIGFAKITRDITERKQAAFALNDSESNFRLLVSGVTDYALYMLDPNGIVTNWNAGGQRIKGYAPEEIIGQHFSKF
jgi:PAS domain S-box-containing protein